MKIEKILKQTFDRGNGLNVNHVTSRSKINGLMIILPWIEDTDKVTLKLRHAEGMEVICNNLPLASFREIGNFYHGNAGSDNITTATSLISYLAADGIITPEQQTGYLNSLALSRGVSQSVILLPLGNLHLSSDTQLEIDLDLSSGAGSGEIITMDVYTYALNVGTSLVYQYNASTDLEQHFNGVDALFMYPKVSGERLMKQVKDVQVQLDFDTHSTIFDLGGIYAACQVFGAYENAPAGTLASLFVNNDVIPAKVFAKMTGADASKVGYIVRRRLYVASLVSKNTAVELGQLINRIEKLETEQPETAKALRHSGAIVKSEQLQVIKDSL